MTMYLEHFGLREAPFRITPHTDFEATVYVLTKDEGGRHKPFFSNYRPQFFFRTTDITGSVALPERMRTVVQVFG